MESGAWEGNVSSRARKSLVAEQVPSFCFQLLPMRNSRGHRSYIMMRSLKSVERKTIPGLMAPEFAEPPRKTITQATLKCRVLGQAKGSGQWKETPENHTPP